MKTIKINGKRIYFYSVFGHKIVRLLLAVFLLCGLFTPYAFGDNNLKISAINQDNNVSGVVSDATGMPLIGVSVLIKGTTQGVITDLDGKFNLKVPHGSVLVFSYIGMRTVEINVANQKEINVVMQENTESIDEVVVIGFGTQKKVNLTGSVGVADAKSAEITSRNDDSSSFARYGAGITNFSEYGRIGKTSKYEYPRYCDNR